MIAAVGGITAPVILETQRFHAIWSSLASRRRIPLTMASFKSASARKQTVTKCGLYAVRPEPV